MDNDSKQNPPDTADDQGSSLESKTTVVQDNDSKPSTTVITTPEAPVKKKSRIRRLLDNFNIYLLLFTLLIVIAIAITVVSLVQNRRSLDRDKLQMTTEPLSEEILNQLRQADVKVGNPRQILSIESNAIFAGKVLIKDSLEVASSINVGGSINAAGFNASGSSVMNELQTSQLQVAGDAAIQGSVNIQNNLTVAGSGNFSGSLTASSLNIQNLQIDGDLQFNRHINPSGGNPGKSDGNAVGSGGTSSVSGTDTAGTITINTGGGPPPGCFITVNFTQPFNGTPHVVITPVGPTAANLNYYVDRSSSNFSVCTTNSAPGSQNFMFDYVVMN